MRGRSADRIVLQKIIDYCADIEDYMKRVNASYEIYLSDKMFRSAVDMCVLQIGELTKRFSEDFKSQHSEIPWRSIKAMRNVLVHEIDFETAWNVLSQRIPELKAQLEKILAAEEGADDSQV